MQQKKLKQYRFNLIVILIFVITFVILGVINPENNNAFRISLTGFLFFIFLSFDYCLIIKAPNLVEERQCFGKELIKHKKLTVFFISFFLIAIIFIQMSLTKKLITLDNVMLNYGIVYNKVINGEYWRLFIGVFFHSGLAHWAINAAMLIGIGTIASTGSKYYSIAIFYFGCVFSAMIALIFTSIGLSSNDGFLGISGGTSALSGFVLYYTTNNKNKYPTYFYLTYAAFFLFLTCIDIITAPVVTTMSHFGGFSIGYLTSIAIYNHLKPIKNMI